jgi:Tfp pilus assembly protein PilX
MRHRNVTLLLLFSFALAAALWAREDRLVNTGAAPAAEGKVVTENDRNGNTKVEVAVKHMATHTSSGCSRAARILSCWALSASMKIWKAA